MTAILNAFSTTSTATASGASQGSGHNGGQSISSVTVPSGANAIYVFDTVAGGGGALRGSDHKGVGEDPGDGGGGGASRLEKSSKSNSSNVRSSAMSSSSDGTGIDGLAGGVVLSIC